MHAWQCMGRHGGQVWAGGQWCVCSIREVVQWACRHVGKGDAGNGRGHEWAGGEKECEEECKECEWDSHSLCPSLSTVQPQRGLQRGWGRCQLSSNLLSNSCTVLVLEPVSQWAQHLNGQCGHP